MGNEVTLVLKGENSNLINKLKEAQTATEKLYIYSTEGAGKLVGVIEKEEEVLRKLQAFKKQAALEDLKYYNQEIDASKKRLQSYDAEGMAVQDLGKNIKDTGKEGETLSGTMGKMALSFGGAAAILGILKQAFLETTQGMKLFNQIGAVTKQVLNDITSGSGLSIERMVSAARAAGALADMKVRDRMESLKNKDLMREYNELYTKGIDQTISASDKIMFLTQAKEKFTEATKNEIESSKEELAILKAIWKDQPTNDKAMADVFNMANHIKDLQGELASGTRRLNAQITGEQKKMWDDLGKSLAGFNKDLQNEIDDINKEVADADKKAKEAALERQKKYQDLSQKLLDDYDKSNIESLTGVEKLKAQRDFGLKQIAEFRKQLAEFGTVTKEQDAIFTALGENVWKAFIKGMEKEAKVSPEQKAAISKALLAGIPSMDELRKTTTNTTPGKKPISSVWELIGIDPESEDGKKAIESLKKGAETAMKAIDDVMQKKVEDAQRTREILDTKISEAEQELNTEADLQKAGFANNVEAKRKEIAALKVQRDAALKQEQDAVKKQRALDTIQQVSSLITASADIFKSMAKIPVVGIPLAIGIIATMFGAFAAAKANANKSAFAKGGWTGRGNQRDETGERVAGTVHEEEYVVRKGPASKFRDVLEAINKDDRRLAFNRFNRISPESLRGSTINNVTVENDGPNKRLDQVNANLKRLDKSRTEVTELMDHTVIRKGNSTRIIRR